MWWSHYRSYNCDGDRRIAQQQRTMDNGNIRFSDIFGVPLVYRQHTIYIIKKNVNISQFYEIFHRPVKYIRLQTLIITAIVGNIIIPSSIHGLTRGRTRGRDETSTGRCLINEHAVVSVK